MWWLLLLPTAYGYSTQTYYMDMPELQSPGDIIFDVNNPFQYDVTYAYDTSSPIASHYNNPEISICAGTYQVKSTSSSHPLYFAGVQVDTEFVTIDLTADTTYACRNHPSMSNNIIVVDCSGATNGLCEQACPMCQYTGACDDCGDCPCGACTDYMGGSGSGSTNCTAECSSCNDCNDWSAYTNKQECLDTECPYCYSCRHEECNDCIDCECWDTSPFGLFKCQQCMVGETSCSICNTDLYNLPTSLCNCLECPWNTIDMCSHHVGDYGTCIDHQHDLGMGNCRPCYEWIAPRFVQ